MAKGENSVPIKSIKTLVLSCTVDAMEEMYIGLGNFWIKKKLGMIGLNISSFSNSKNI